MWKTDAVFPLMIFLYNESMYLQKCLQICSPDDILRRFKSNTILMLNDTDIKYKVEQTVETDIEGRKK